MLLHFQNRSHFKTVELYCNQCIETTVIPKSSILSYHTTLCQGNNCHIECVIKKLFSKCNATLNCMFVSVISNPGAVKGPTATYSQRVYLPDGMIPKYTGYVPSKYNMAITMAYVSTLSISGGKSHFSSPIPLSLFSFKISSFFCVFRIGLFASFCVFPIWNLKLRLYGCGLFQRHFSLLSLTACMRATSLIRTFSIF